MGRLWEAFRTGGAPALAELVPGDVEWRPFQAGRQALRGSAELDQFWAARDARVPVPTMFQAHGDHVVVRADLPLPDGGVKPLWSLYRFHGPKLTHAITFESEAQALTHLRQDSPPGPEPSEVTEPH